MLKRVIRAIVEYRLNFPFWVCFHFLRTTVKSFNFSKYYLIRTQPIKIKDAVLFTDPDDCGIGRCLTINPSREELNQIMLTEIGEDDVVLDLGANIGYYVLKEAPLAKKVIAIEPVSSNFSLLQKNVATNNHPNVELHRFAFGDYIGEAKIFISENSNHHSFSGHMDGKIVGEEVVPITTLDDFVSNGTLPTFIRMDVEGYEYNILKGASNLLEKSKHLKLMIEVHPLKMGPEKTAEFLDILEKQGFLISYLVRDNTYYPHFKVGSFGHKLMWFFERRFNKFATQKNQVYRNVSFEELRQDFLSGNMECPHILFEK